MVRAIKDANLIISRALPNGAATVNSTGLNLAQSTRGDFVAGAEILIEAPALTVAQLADASTIIYTLQHDNDSAFGTVTDLATNCLTQTGAGGAGAAAASVRVGLASNVKQYLRLKAVKTGAADASAAIAYMSLVF